MYNNDYCNLTKSLIMSDIECIKSKKIAHNTVEYTTNNNKKCIRYCFTDVVIIHENGNVTINTDNWNTPTTIKRIHDNNDIVRASTQKGEMFLSTKTCDWFMYRYYEHYKHFEGITFDKNGYITGDNVEISYLIDKVNTELTFYSKQLKKLNKGTFKFKDEPEYSWDGKKNNRELILGDSQAKELTKKHLENKVKHCEKSLKFLNRINNSRINKFMTQMDLDNFYSLYRPK